MLFVGDELLSDSFTYKEIENGCLWEVEGKVWLINFLWLISCFSCLIYMFQFSFWCAFSYTQWVVTGAVDVDIGVNPSAEGAGEDEGVDDQAVKVVDIVDTFRLQVCFVLRTHYGFVGFRGLTLFFLQEQPPFDKKQFIGYIKKYIKILTPKLDAEKQE